MEGLGVTADTNERRPQAGKDTGGCGHGERAKDCRLSNRTRNAAGLDKGDRPEERPPRQEP